MSLETVAGGAPHATRLRRAREEAGAAMRYWGRFMNISAASACHASLLLSATCRRFTALSSVRASYALMSTRPRHRIIREKKASEVWFKPSFVRRLRYRVEALSVIVKRVEACRVREGAGDAR